MKKQTLVTGALTLAVGGFLAKVIGALYRIPLLSLIGGKGMGLYQLVYPFYCLLLTVSATGIPSAISTLVAKKTALGESDEGVFKTALKLFSFVGAAGTVFMLLLSPVLSFLQKEKGVISGYFALAPSVFLVSAIAVLRGFFQGRKDMRPTALSEILEQLIKVGFGLLFAYLYRGNLKKTIPLLLFAVTVSEFITLLFLIVLYKRIPAPYKGLKNTEKTKKKEILALSIPVTLSSAVLPLCSLIESVVLVRLMSKYTPLSVSLYGLFAGGAITLVNLPVSLCYGVAASAVPSVAESVESGERKKKILTCFFLTFALSFVFSLGLFFFAKTAVFILFKGLSDFEKTTLIKLVKILSWSAIFHSCAQTLSACLTAQGKPLHSTLSLFVSAAVRLVVDCLLVQNAKFSIFGAAIAANIGYFVAFLMDLLYNMKNGRQKGATYDNDSKLGRRRGRFNAKGKIGDFIR